MIVTHWSARPLSMPLSVCKQSAPWVPFGKPRGFWVSDEAEYGWSAWCIDNEMSEKRLEFRSEFELMTDRVLLITSADALDDFNREFGNAKEDTYGRLGVDWRNVSMAYDGIMITPYRDDRRLVFDWYYGWDCASGCIWRPTECLVQIKTDRHVAEAECFPAFIASGDDAG